MSAESDIQALLIGLCPRSRVDFFDKLPAMPYVTWQIIGGRSIRFLNNEAGDKRNTRVQINVYAATRVGSLSLIRSIEAAMCASSLFTATPDAEPMTDFDADMLTYEAIQDFSIYSTR